MKQPGFAVATTSAAVVTSSSDAKIERAIGLGAWKGVNYVDEPEWGVAVREAVLDLLAGSRQ